MVHNILVLVTYQCLHFYYKGRKISCVIFICSFNGTFYPVRAVLAVDNTAQQPRAKWRLLRFQVCKHSAAAAKCLHIFESNSFAPVKWYRSTFYNITILGVCNFAAPGIWGAMNSLGAGGAQKPYLVNTANALTFCLMVVSCLFSSALVRLIGIKGALLFGT